MTEPARTTETATWRDGEEPPIVADLPPRWRLERTLGRGGQATVWLARDTELEQWVALKVFRAGADAAWRERMRREVRIGRELAHPGVVRVYELVEGDGCVAAAMEWIDGETLAGRLAAGPLPIEDAVELATQLLEVLSHLHGHEIIHRDVKPSNILIEPDGRVRLADLGLARPLDGAADVTRTNKTVGTPTYMSPEQLRGETATPASDLYSLGATLYHSITGAPPYEGDSGFAVADGHLRAPIPNPRARRPDCPRWLARFIRRLLEKRPADRWPDAGAAARAFGGRRRLTSPRVWRRAAIIACASCAAAWAVAAAWSARHGETASAHLAGNEVVVLDDAGRQLWRAEIAGFQPRAAVVADLIGDPEPEVAVALVPTTAGPAAPPSQVRVLSGSRHQIASVELGGSFPTYPRTDRATSDPLLWLGDVDADDSLELGWIAQSADSYPSEAGLIDLRRGVTGPFITNSGHIHDVSVGDLDGDGTPEVAVAGLNNALGFQLTVAIVRLLETPSRATYWIAPSPDQLSQWRTFAGAASRRMAGYTLLGPTNGVAHVVASPAQGIVVQTADREVHLDVFGNPEGSPLHGGGPEPRLRFWDDLVDTAFEIEAHAPDGAQRAAALLTRHPEVLSEDPMHLAAVLLLARSLARAGDLGAASELLLAASTRHPDSPDLWTARGTCLAAAGRIQESLDALDIAVRVGARTARASEPLLDMFRIAGFAGDERRFAESLDIWSAKYSTPFGGERHAAARALWSFFRGDWNDPSLDAGRAVKPGVPELGVTVAWASLERSGDVDGALLQARRLEELPAVRDLAVLLEAEALRRLGEPARAADLALQQRHELERAGREDVAYLLWVPLADHIAAEALTALGRSAEAAELTARAAAAAPACWFGH